MADTIHPWGSYPLAEDATLCGRFGDLKVYVRKRSGDWYVGRESHPEGEAFEIPRIVPGDESPDVVWSRWVSGDGESAEAGTVEFTPALPDRAVLVRPSGTFLVPPDTRVTLYFELPYRISLSAKEPRSVPLGAFPTEVLSSTWIGDPGDGRLAYVIRVDPTKNFRDISHRRWCVLCPMEIRNASKEEIAFDRFILDPDYLGIWQGPKRLWTDTLIVTIRGADVPATVEAAKGSPRGSEGAKRIVEPPRGSRKGFIADGVSWMREIGIKIPGAL